VARRAVVIGLLVLCACSAGEGSTTVSSSSSSSHSSTSSSRTDSSTIRTNGGTVIVRRGAGGLEVVDLSPMDGWAAHHTTSGTVHLDVTFERPGSRVEVAVTLTPTGISSSSRSVTTG
jgi:hypothetical protein